MGRIKTKLIKRVTHELISRFPGKFSSSYEENKKVIGELIIVDSKKIKNTIAGYLTRLKKSQPEDNIML